jgi:hypothetical protein
MTKKTTFTPIHLSRAHLSWAHLSWARLSWAVFASGAWLACAMPADANELHLSYVANWGGLHVADFSLSMTDDTDRGGDNYENLFHLESRGLTRTLTNMSITANSRGHIIAPPPRPKEAALMNNTAGLPLSKTYMTKNYRTQYTNSKHFRWVNIDFGPVGEPAHASTGTSPIPGREDAWNPAEKGPEVLEKVDEKYRIGVNDPITLIPQLMAVVRAHLKGGPSNASMKGFDGRRRFDIDISYLGLATRVIGGIKHDTYRVRVTPNPVAGFKSRQKIVWDGSVYDFYLSRDGRFVPLQIVPVNHGPVLTLTKECQTPCIIKAEE